MDPTFGVILVVGFPVVLILLLMAFGRFSVRPK